MNEVSLPKQLDGGIWADDCEQELSGRGTMFPCKRTRFRLTPQKGQHNVSVSGRDFVEHLEMGNTMFLYHLLRSLMAGPH